MKSSDVEGASPPLDPMAPRAGAAGLRGPRSPEAPMTFEELYDAHFRFVWRSLRRLDVSEADTPDAVQDVFLVVHRRLHEFEGRAKITTWLYRICLRVAHDHRRKAYVRRELPASDELASEPSRAPAASEQAERRQALRQLEAALADMPMEQRAVFTLFEFEQMSGHQIAQTLEIPLGTVYSRLRLAREVFRKSISRQQSMPRGRGGSQEASR